MNSLISSLGIFICIGTVLALVLVVLLVRALSSGHRPMNRHLSDTSPANGPTEVIEPGSVPNTGSGGVIGSSGFREQPPAGSAKVYEAPRKRL